MNPLWPAGPVFRLRVALCAAALAVCAAAAAGEAAPPALPWRDADVPRPPALPQAAEVLAPSDAMRAWLERPEMRAAVRRVGAQKALVEALYRPDGLQLRYDQGPTRTAAQAFDDRAGNCLSLVLMTAAFAQALNLQVEFNGVEAAPDWWRSGGLIAASGHVNVSLVGAVPGEPGLGPRRLRSTIDFVAPGERPPALATTPLPLDTVLALFLRNRAAEALADDRVDAAYWLLREALALAPDLLASRNALAVVYLRRGWLDDAATVLQGVLAQSPDHVPALANLAQVRRAQGRGAEAQALSARRVRLEPTPPFADYDDGVAALARGDALAGRASFERSLRAHPQHHESHFGLAMALLRLDEPAAARQALDTALRLSPPGAAQALYAAKRARLDGAATVH
jgi:Tetratricopeptide repeat